ncbi:MAG: TlpA family protein disulfide reductase [Bacteroidales bacterium]|nr:TlpA family protein disulfide reductase [Bacteroidales bacterium]
MNTYRPTIRFALLSVCMLMALSAVGQTNVAIRGRVVDGVGKRVMLGAYSDMLTRREVGLDSAVVGDDGSFVLRCYANYPRLVFVEIECYSQSFYIEPGREYEVLVPEFDWDLNEKKNVYLDPVALPLLFQNIDDSDLNVRMMRYEETVDSFLSANRERVDFRFHPDRRVFKELFTLVKNRFVSDDEADSFFGRYVDYSMLEMALALRMESRAKLAARYVEPIRYHDESYMRFFLEVFSHTISGGTKKVAQWKMAEWIKKGDAAGWLDTLGLDPLLQNEQVRELAALEALKEMFYDKSYDRHGVRLTTEHLRDATKFADHRVLAESLLASFDLHERAREPKGFTLPDVERRMVNLADLKGKWVYLSFVRVGDPNSIKELETMAHFRDTVYRTWPDVVFVTIACDREFQKMYHLLKNSKKGARYNWTWLHFDGDYRLLERFGVTSYPTFVLLNPEGKQVYDYTPAPASGILLRGPWIKNEDNREWGTYKF